MGIKGLWGVLAPYSEKKSLHEIRGQTIAVDLSGWVCDSQNVTDFHIQPKLYLRNLFFRTIYLLLAEIDPIFVLEGDAPELKQNVMAARNAIQFRGAAPRTEEASKKRPDVARNRFKNVLKECESLLKCMGVRCIKGRGEAEATCAELNARGVAVTTAFQRKRNQCARSIRTSKNLVDAVVSQDSDCYAYGARVVYRNFSVSSSAGGSALQGSIDYYDADRMFRSNGFGRNKMVALALLCGCDYGVGACGSSINTVVSFLHTVPDNDIIPRLLSWVSDPRKYEELERWVSAPGRCDRCGHAGRTHAKNGCPTCATHKGCSDTGHKTKVAEVKRELSLRTKAMSCGMPFPEPKVMKEFLNATPEDINTQHLKKPVPSLIQFVKLMLNKLSWPERYCVEKFLPLLTKWHLQDNVPCRTIKPLMIKKKRNPRGVPSYEIVWGDIDGEYEGLIPDDQFEVNEDTSKSWTTTERQDSIRQYYPELVETYEQLTKKPPIEKKRRGRKKNENNDLVKPKRKYTKKSKKHIDADVVNVSHSMKNSIFALTKSETNSSKLNVSVKVNKLKRKLKNISKGKGQKTVDSFIISKRRKSNKKLMKSLQCSFKNMTLDNDEQIDTKFLEKISYEKENLRENNHYLSMLNTETEDCDTFDSDLSDIVDNIVTRAPLIKTARVDSKLVKLIFDNKHSTPTKSKRKSVLNEIYNNCSTPRDSPKRRSSYKISENSNYFSNHNANISYFFDKLSEDRDAFELSLDYKQKSAIKNLDCDVTVEYSLPDVHL